MESLKLEVEKLEEKYFNEELERFYYGLSQEECEVIEQRMRKSMINASFNNLNNIVPANRAKFNLNHKLIDLYIGEVDIIRKSIAYKEYSKLKDIRKRYKSKLKRKFI